RTVERKHYQAEIQITSAGHLVRWQSGGMTLTEVATSAHHPMPEQRRLISSSLRGTRRERVECNGGVIYEVEFQMEPVDQDLFWAFQNEILQDGEKQGQGMLQKFESSGRVALGAVSYVYPETRERSMTIQAFHTFPDDYAIVRSESRFILPQ
ncbi:MAG: DUF2617 family protein, partial [Planctomycetia bacterium]